MNIARLPRTHRLEPKAALSLLCLAACLSAGVATSCAPAVAAQAADNQEYSVRIAYKAGEVNRYRWIIETKFKDAQDGKEKPLFIRMILKETTKAVKPDGAAVLESGFEEAYAKIGDQEEDDSAQMPRRITQTRDPLGRVLEGKIEGGNPLVVGASGGETMFSQTAVAFYPPGPVKIGDTWKIALTPKNPKLGTYQMNGTATLLGTETIENVKTLKIKATTETTGSDKTAARLHFEGVGNLDAVTGKLLRLSGTSQSFAGTLGNNPIQIHAELLTDAGKAGAEKKADTKKP
ncbi:MAG TPA: hypothetical protein VFB21_05350 [Chthonomonadaceae bacterium]|nr:hypothetical protein [Chthonomonadaceae bacterium]